MKRARDEERQRGAGKTIKVVGIAAMRQLRNRGLELDNSSETFGAAIACYGFATGRELALDGPHST
jgi:hypothetical protein